MRNILALALLLAVCGCGKDISADKATATSDTVKREWRKHPPRPLMEEQWDFVCPSTGRLDGAQVNFSSVQNDWKVWSQGEGYGEFATKEEAIKQAERITALRVGASRVEPCT